MRYARIAVLSLFLIPTSYVCAQTPAHAATSKVATTAPATKYVKADAIDLKETLPDPPANDSDVTAKELQKILALQASRTPEQVARAKSEETLTVWAFADVVGSSFNASKLPKTARMLKQVETDTKAITDNAKKFWSRPRPYELDKKIEPCVAKPGNAAYPSGHTSRAFSWAIVLGKLYPEKGQELLARAQEIGDDRVIAGVHYDTDVEAGQALGMLIGDKIVASPAFLLDLMLAKAEIAATAEVAATIAK